MPLSMKEKLEKASESVRTGGKGTMRRKRKAPHKTNAGDDRRVHDNLKKLGVSPIGDIEEVNLIMANGTVVHFANPKVQASIPSNTYVVTGHGETKPLQEMLPQIIQQLGAENVDQLKNMAKEMGGAGGAPPAPAKVEEAKPDADAIPVTEDFE